MSPSPPLSLPLRLATFALVALGLLGAACKRKGNDTILVVNIDLAANPAAPVARVLVAVEAGKDRRSHEFADDGDSNGVIGFPSRFSLQLPGTVGSPVRLEVSALDASGRVLAAGKGDRVEFAPGERKEVDVHLFCVATCPSEGPGNDAARPDGGVVDAVVPARDVTQSLCGNGRLDENELCDPGIAAGHAGACPPASCDDKVPCTEDKAVGSDCRLTCEHKTIDVLKAGDRCCPAGATAATDSDCSATCGNGKRELDETCEINLVPGDPGSCPVEGSCDDGDPCTRDELISAGTCAATCVHQPIAQAVPGDLCCPPGVPASEDNDCRAVCGNWQPDPNETCDRARPSGSPGSCPVSCAAPNDGCLVNVIAGTGCAVRCAETSLTLVAPDDRCCPIGANRNIDSDCPTRCGNRVLEPGETCDTMIPDGQPGACPSTCAKPTDQCLISRLEGTSKDCSTRCTVQPVTLCGPGADGCCPSGCTPANDPDCSTTCGNGTLELGETCDTTIPAGTPGACPTTCQDTNACTTDRLLSGGTCHARCAYVPVTHFNIDDDCCPPGANHLLDRDCPAACGNGLVEAPGETCDRGIAPPAMGSCVTTCPVLAPGCTRFMLRGAPETCSTSCVLETVGACTNDDGCCPAGCTRLSDNDCPAVCGNGVVEEGEACDVGLTAGKIGSCPALCDDGNVCTSDVRLGRRIDCTRSCRFDPITVCRDGDQCCPAGCTREFDSDCAPTCGNRLVEAEESCDPPGTCPTRCADDGDPCTSELLTGDAKACKARCTSVPIETCSGTQTDLCCPTGCGAKTDVDCTLPATQPPLL